MSGRCRLCSGASPSPSADTVPSTGYDLPTMRTAARPFLFVGCVELRQTLDMHALDERELMHRVAEVPVDSVFFHTFGYFLRHRPFTTAYGNDFARWAALEIGDRALAERLAVVDPFAFPTVEALREHLVTILQDHLRARGGDLRVEFDRACHFQRSHLVEVELGLAATTLAEFRAGLAAADATAIYLHAVEARARGGRRAGDFAEWLRGALELPALAERFERIDQYRQVAPPGVVDVIQKLAERVRGRRFLNLTGGRLGGGVAEILRTAVPILSDLGVDTSWEITGGDQAYYATARTLQATLEGAERVLSDEGLAH